MAQKVNITTRCHPRTLHGANAAFPRDPDYAYAGVAYRRFSLFRELKKLLGFSTSIRQPKR